MMTTVTFCLAVVSVSAGRFIYRWNILRTAKFKLGTKFSAVYRYVFHGITGSIIIISAGGGVCSTSSKDWSPSVR